jgi:hypothetical protein
MKPFPFNTNTINTNTINTNTINTNSTSPNGYDRQDCSGSWCYWLYWQGTVHVMCVVGLNLLQPLLTHRSCALLKELVRELLVSTHYREVRTLTRRTYDYAWFASLSSEQQAKLQQHIVNYEDLAASSGVFDGCNVAFCCLGTTRKVAGSDVCCSNALYSNTTQLAVSWHHQRNHGTVSRRHSGMWITTISSRPHAWHRNIALHRSTWCRPLEPMHHQCSCIHEPRARPKPPSAAFTLMH